MTVFDKVNEVETLLSGLDGTTLQVLSNNTVVQEFVLAMTALNAIPIPELLYTAKVDDDELINHYQEIYNISSDVECLLHVASTLLLDDDEILEFLQERR